MKTKALKTLFTLCLAIILTWALQAQTSVSGKVMNEKGEAIPYAVVHLPSFGIGTLTDENGMFSMTNVPTGKLTFEISAIGYESNSAKLNVVADQKNELNCSLSEKSLGLNTVVVTGNSNPKSALESSISVSALNGSDIKNANVRTTAEIFRTIPGIRSESSGGDGNSNITVRGVPISAGGSRYLLIQEDGLPVLQFGDVAFGTQDQFLRYDNNVSRVEALRGGSASVLASNSPAGIINFISKTGETQGGSVATSYGLDYRNIRTDVELGTSLGNNFSMHVGGFYRMGDGPRKTGFTSNNGGQLKMNITKRFNNGYARIYTKLLDDRTAAYMPLPIEVSGTDSDPKWKSLKNYDALHASMQTVHMLSDKTIDGNGNILTSDVSDGMHSKTKSIGSEFSLNLNGGWNINNKTRYAINNGQFLAPFPASVGTATQILDGIATGGVAYYAGTNQTVDPNGVYMRTHLFNTSLNNFNNFISNTNLAKSFNRLKLNVGLYKSIQNIDMSWHWNTYLMEVSDDNARMVEIRDAANVNYSPNGLLAYGVPAWGNCCNRNYSTKYDITAPYADVEIELTNKLNLDAGLRWDNGHVFGNFSGGNGQTASIDMNGNGTIDENEKKVATTTSLTTPVNYDYDYLSYSGGLNYLLSDMNAVFVRTSSGASASADRVLFNGLNYTNSDDPALDAQKINTVNQTELGFKHKGKNLVYNATLFLANTVESNYEATTQKKIDNKYQSIGLELDAEANINDHLGIRGGLTFTKAEISDSKDAAVVGNTPRRTPALMFHLLPSYQAKKVFFGIGLIGATDSYTQDNNKLKMPAYVLVNPFVRIALKNNFELSLESNNVLDAIGITESEEDSIGANSSLIVRARPLPGRSTSIGLSYHF